MPRRPAQASPGKLTAVASRWASGRGGKPADDVASDAAAEARAKIAARRAKVGGAPSEPEIGPDEYDVVTLFFGLASQWRLHAMSGMRLGLDYAAIPATAAMMGIVMTPQLFEDLGTMERAALTVFHTR